MNSIQIAEDMQKVFERALPFQVPNFNKRVRITSDTDKYKWKEEESVYLQKKGKAPLSFEVLFDGEFVCFFDLSEREQDVIIKMLQGIRKLFLEKKVFLHEQMYEVIRAEREAKEKEIELPTPTNEAESIVAEVFKKKAKKRNKKVIYKG